MLLDPPSPSPCPTGEVTRQEEEKELGTEEKEVRGDGQPAACDRRLPQGHESRIKLKERATQNNLKLEFI